MKNIIATSLLAFGLTLPAKADILKQPQNTKACKGELARFTVASNNTATAYQWRKGGKNLADVANISGSHSSTLIISNVSADDLGSYDCIVTEQVGALAVGVTSNPASLGLNTDVAIISEPVDFNATEKKDAAFSVAATDATSYQWQVDDGSGFKNVSGTNYNGATRNTLKITQATIKMSGYKYRCIVSGECGSSVTSASVELGVGIVIKGTLPQTVNVPYNGSRELRLEASSSGTLSYQWQENRGSGYVNIPGETNSTYKIDNPDCDRSYRKYRCQLSSHKDEPVYSKTVQLFVDGCMAKSYFSMTAAYMVSPGVKGTANLTQTDLRINIPLRKKQGIPDDTKGGRLMFSRNIFIQGRYTSNADDLPVVDSMNSGGLVDILGRYKSVNKLDLHQHAQLNLAIHALSLTYIVPRTEHQGNVLHFYAQPFFGFLNTNIKDTARHETSGVLSMQYGVNFAMRIQHLFFEKSPIYFEFSTRMFGVSALGSTVADDLNYQWDRVYADYQTAQNPRKPLYVGTWHPYYNFEAQIIYKTNKKNSESESSQVFVRANYFSNLAGRNSLVASNAYSLFQIGYSLDINKFISTLSTRTSTPSTPATPPIPEVPTPPLAP